MLPNLQDSCLLQGQRGGRKAEEKLLDMNCPPNYLEAVFPFLFKHSKTQLAIVSEFPCCTYLLRMAEMGLRSGSVGKDLLYKCADLNSDPQMQKTMDMVVFIYNLSALTAR